MFDSGNEAMLTDAMLITLQHGVVIFDLTTLSETNTDKIFEYQDELYRGVFQKFLSQKELLKRRDLAFDIKVISIRNDELKDDSFSTMESLVEKISEFDALDLQLFKQINATIQKTDVLKPSKKKQRYARRFLWRYNEKY
jgi:superfamily I DNA and RNA helicase